MGLLGNALVVLLICDYCPKCRNDFQSKTLVTTFAPVVSVTSFLRAFVV